jgi:hypothetical protein
VLAPGSARFRNEWVGLHELKEGLLIRELMWPDGRRWPTPRLPQARDETALCIDADDSAACRTRRIPQACWVDYSDPHLCYDREVAENAWLTESRVTCRKPGAKFICYQSLYGNIVREAQSQRHRIEQMGGIES